jgi:hypothetical protein
MRVQIDEAGHDEPAADSDGLGPAGGQVAADLDDFAVGEGDVGGLVAAARRIDHPPALEDQISHRFLVRSSRRGTRRFGVSANAVYGICLSRQKEVGLACRRRSKR